MLVKIYSTDLPLTDQSKVFILPGMEIAIKHNFGPLDLSLRPEHHVTSLTFMETGPL